MARSTAHWRAGLTCTSTRYFTCQGWPAAVGATTVVVVASTTAGSQGQGGDGAEGVLLAVDEVAVIGVALW
mgnify:CR=1 FL=1